MFCIIFLLALIQLVYLQDNFQHMDTCLLDDQCIRSIEQNICSVITEDYYKQVHNHLRPLNDIKNLIIKGQDMFNNDLFLVNEDFYKFLISKYKRDCLPVEIDYLLNKCPLTYNKHSDEDDILYFTMGCMKIRDEQFQKFKQCLQDRVEDNFEWNTETKMDEEQNTKIKFHILCFKTVSKEEYKLIEDYKQITKQCIVNEICSKGLLDKLKKGFSESEIHFNKDFCSQKCESCSDYSECEKCKGGYYLDHGHCLEEDCPEPKVIFNGICQLCPEGYSKQDKYCTKCQIENCKVCNKYYFCNQCKDDYLQEGLNCVQECSKGYYQEDNKCLKCPQKCISCENRFSCLQCMSNHKVQDGSCVLNCQEGEYYINQQCQKCTDDCKQCKDKTTCMICQDGYYLQRNDGTCHKNCRNDQYQKDKICEDCSQNCLGCTGPTDEDCKACSVSQSICEVIGISEQINNQEESKGKKHCKLTPYNCNKCTSSGDCDSCQENHILSKETKNCFLPNDQCDDGNCDKCDYSETDQKCYFCKSEYFLDPNDNECKKECPEGTFDNKDKQCQQCYEGCKICSGSSSEDCQDNQFPLKQIIIGVVVTGGIAVSAAIVYKLRKIYQEYKDNNYEPFQQGQDNHIELGPN